MNPSHIYCRPLIRADTRYYLPFAPHMFRSLKSIASALIKSANPEFADQRWPHVRGDFLVSKVAVLLSAWFGAEHVHVGCYYNVGGEKGERCEADIIVNAPGVLLLVECKSGQLAASARRGGPDRLRDNLKELISNAQQQATRTLEYVMSAYSAQFTDSTGLERLRVKRSTIHQIFLINVTLEHLGHVGCDTTTLRRMNLVSAETVSWIVSVADLMAIAEILDGPAAFLHYLLRRRRLADLPFIHASDELDCVAYYLRQGLWFEDADFCDQKQVFLGTWTDDLDRFFRNKYELPERDQDPNIEKPTRRIPGKIAPLVEALEERCEGPGLAAAVALLDFDEESLESLSRNVMKLENLVRRDGRAHTLRVGGKTMLAELFLACHVGAFTADEAEAFARRRRSNRTQPVFVVTWTVPLERSKVRVWAFRRANVG